MNQRIEHCLYQAGLTAQGCWDELDDYARQGIEKFAQLIVQECADKCLEMAYANPGPHHYAAMLKEHFGVEEHHAD